MQNQSFKEEKKIYLFFSNYSEETYRSFPSTPGQDAQSRTEGTSKQYFFQYSANQRANCSNQECSEQGKTFGLLVTSANNQILL